MDFFKSSKSKIQKTPTTEPFKKKISRQGRKINLNKQLANKIWTKIPSISQFELNPFKCSRYIMRLAHAFYFELKFINFTNPSENDEDLDYVQ